jgi:hypothetical protein
MSNFKYTTVGEDAQGFGLYLCVKMCPPGVPLVCIDEDGQCVEVESNRPLRSVGTSVSSTSTPHYYWSF